MYNRIIESNNSLVLQKGSGPDWNPGVGRNPEHPSGEALLCHLCTCATHGSTIQNSTTVFHIINTNRPHWKCQFWKKSECDYFEWSINLLRQTIQKISNLVFFLVLYNFSQLSNVPNILAGVHFNVSKKGYVQIPFDF